MSLTAARVEAVSGRRLDDALFVAIGLSWGAGFIHVAASYRHLDYVPYAAAFAMLAAIQFAWGVLVYRRPSRTLLVAGALLSLGTVCVWLVSRTSGLPVGPERWRPEAWGLPDTVASADELTLCVLLALGSAGQRRALRGAAVAFGVALILLSSLSVVSGGHVH